MTIAITPTSTRDAQREIARIVALRFPQLGRALTAMVEGSRMSQNGHGMGYGEPITAPRPLSK